MPLRGPFAVSGPVPASTASLAAADRGSRNASLTLGLTLPGDTVLYLLLPLHAAAFGVNLPEAGLLLAANRLVRIAGYGWVARGYERFGPRAACFAAALGRRRRPSATRLLSGVWALIAARLLWGLVLRRAQHRDAGAWRPPSPTARRGAAASRARSSRPGRCSGLLGGGARAETRAAHRFPGAGGDRRCSACRWRCGAGRAGADGARRARRRFGLPSPLDCGSFIQGLTLDGVFVVGLVVLAVASHRRKARRLAAGAALALRYARRDRAGPAERARRRALGRGALADRRVAASAAGYGAICVGAVWAGIVAIVLLRGVLAPLAGAGRGEVNPGAARVPAIAGWRPGATSAPGSGR